MDVIHDGNRIYIKNDDGITLAYTDYNEQLYTSVKAEKWHVSGDYMRCSRLKRSFHQFVMEFWYGREAFQNSLKNGYIVEHHDNDGSNCTIRNMSFALRDHNLAKAHTYDKQRPIIIQSFAINFFKDFETQHYQITIGFNRSFNIHDLQSGEVIPIAALYLLYEDDFYRTITDATTFIHEIKQYGTCDLTKLRYKEIHFKRAIVISADQKNKVFVEHEGKPALVLGTDKVIITQIAPNEDLFKTNTNYNKKEL